MGIGSIPKSEKSSGIGTVRVGGNAAGGKAAAGVARTSAKPTVPPSRTGLRSLQPQRQSTEIEVEVSAVSAVAIEVGAAPVPSTTGLHGRAAAVT